MEANKHNWDDHSYRCRIADILLARLSPALIVQDCPDDYGSDVTPDHLNFVWDRLYEGLMPLSLHELFGMLESLRKEEQYARVSELKD